MLRVIQRNLGINRNLTAVQLQFLGGKGIGLALLPGEEDLDDIVMRPSQVKIQPDPRYAVDEAKLTIDIVRPATLITPTRLSPEAIQILSWNGVPHVAFEELQQLSFRRDFEALVDWPEDGPLMGLMEAITRVGDVMQLRRARRMGGAAHPRGILSIYWNECDDEQDGLDFGDRNAPQWPDYLSGRPSSLAETCLVNLQAGFRPESLPYLKEKLRTFIDNLLTCHVDRFLITVEYAISAVCVPGKWPCYRLAVPS